MEPKAKNIGTKHYFPTQANKALEIIDEILQEKKNYFE